MLFDVSFTLQPVLTITLQQPFLGQLNKNSNRLAARHSAVIVVLLMSAAHMRVVGGCLRLHCERFASKPRIAMVAVEHAA